MIKKLIITGLELGNRRSRKTGHEHICAMNARLLTQEAACQRRYRCFLSAEQRYKQSSDLCDSQLLGPSRFSEHMCPHCSSSSCQRSGAPHSSFPSTISSRYEAARAQGCCWLSTGLAAPKARRDPRLADAEKSSTRAKTRHEIKEICLKTGRVAAPGHFKYLYFSTYLIFESS